MSLGAGFADLPSLTCRNKSIFSGTSDLQERPLHRISTTGWLASRTSVWSRVRCQYKTWRFKLCNDILHAILSCADADAKIEL